MTLNMVYGNYLEVSLTPSFSTNECNHITHTETNQYKLKTGKIQL